MSTNTDPHANHSGKWTAQNTALMLVVCNSILTEVKLSADILDRGARVLDPREIVPTSRDTVTHDGQDYLKYPSTTQNSVTRLTDVGLAALTRDIASVQSIIAARNKDEGKVLARILRLCSPAMTMTMKNLDRKSVV